MSYKTFKNEEKWIIIGIIVLFLVGCVLHSLYDISGKIFLLAFISPANESIWEHTKMVVFPIICWWSVYYCIKGKSDNINKDKWFEGALASLIVSIILIPIVYYFYTSAFGIENLWIDIGILLIALIGGQLTGLHLYRYSKGISSTIVIFTFIVIISIYIILTLHPLKLPIFMDSITKSYGIK